MNDWQATEDARVDKHQRGINELLAYVSLPADHPSGDLKDMRDAVEAVIVDASWDEFQNHAALAKIDALGSLDRLIVVAEKREADAAELEQLRAAQAQRDRVDAERRAADEAAAAEAAQVERDRLAVEQRKADIATAAAEAAAQAERDAAQRIADAEQATKDVRDRADREIAQAEALAERAAETERQRLADEKSAEEAEQRRRDANREHRKSVNNSIVTALVACAGITSEQARNIVVHIVDGLVPNVTLKY